MRLFEVCAGWGGPEGWGRGGAMFSLGENIARRKGVKQAVYDTPAFSQVFGEELNEAGGETFVPSPRLLLLLYLWLWSCCLYPPSLPPFLPPSLLSSLPPSFSWCQVARCLLLLSISFHLWALQFQPVPLSGIRKAQSSASRTFKRYLTHT